MNFSRLLFAIYLIVSVAIGQTFFGVTFTRSYCSCNNNYCTTVFDTSYNVTVDMTSMTMIPMNNVTLHTLKSAIDDIVSFTFMVKEVGYCFFSGLQFQAKFD